MKLLSNEQIVAQDSSPFSFTEEKFNREVVALALVFHAQSQNNQEAYQGLEEQALNSVYLSEWAKSQIKNSRESDPQDMLVDLSFLVERFKQSTTPSISALL